MWADRGGPWPFLLSNTWLSPDYKKGEQIPCLSVTTGLVVSCKVVFSENTGTIQDIVLTHFGSEQRQV